MDYCIRYKEPNLQYLHIEGVFDTRGMHEIELQFPAWRPGRYELGNFAKNVKNFSVVDDKNHKCTALKTGKDKWNVHCEGVDQIKVFYQYFAADLNAGSSFMNDQQLYVNPVNCLIYIKERQEEKCSLEIDVPTDFKIACGAPFENKIIRCDSFHELVDSPFIASASLQHKSFIVLNRNFHLWFQGQVDINWERVVNDFKRFIKIQIEQFSDRKNKVVGFPVKDYHFLYQILPIKAYHGVEHVTSTVIALGPSHALMNEQYDDFLGVSSHELYHVWNIKSIRPAEMYPYDYSRENYSQLGYVAEGVTTYLGDVFLALSGVKPFEWYKLELEKLLQKHFDNFGRFNYSVAESSWDTWLDGYVKGAPSRKVSIYNEGAILAFVTDMMIRKGSKNKASIHDVMNKLYVDFALKNKGYTESDYIACCESFSGQDMSAFFANFVHGSLPFESILVEALETVGHELIMEENPKHAERILGIKSSEMDSKTIVQEIYPGSSAALGGLMIGDEIVAVNDQRVKEDLHQIMEFFAERTICLQIDRMGRVLSIECPNTNKSQYPIYKIKKMSIPHNLYKNIFKKWIGTKWEEV